ENILNKKRKGLRERSILIQDDGGREGREEKGHIIILYRGNLSGRGKRGFAEKGRRRSVCGRKLRRK
ncbi:hypothetical protein ACIXUB_12160, partial [Bacteroides fragilis]